MFVIPVESGIFRNLEIPNSPLGRSPFYLPFGDVAKRWLRVLGAIENKNLLEGVYKRL